MLILPKNIDDSMLQDIEVTKSDSQISGYPLRQAHYRLGKRIVDELVHNGLNSNDTLCLKILMRSGLCFGLGIADELEQRGYQVDIHFLGKNEDDTKRNYEKIIFVDGVINTGQSLLNFIQKYPSNQIIAITNVISQLGILTLDSYKVYAIRSSSNFYKGSKSKIINAIFGPDTSERLFQSRFFKK